MKRLVVAGMALALCAGIAPARAFHDPGVPVIDELTAQGTRWVSWRFVLPRSARVSYEVRIAGGPERRQAALAAWLAGDNGTWFSVLGLDNPGNGGTHVQTIATGVVTDEPGRPMVVDHGVAVNHVLPAGAYTLVLGWDGADAGTGRLYGESVLQVRGRTDGASARWYPQRAFDGVANADMEGSGATVAGGVSATVGDALFGIFSRAPGTGFETIGFVGPSRAGILVGDIVRADSRGPSAAVAGSADFVFLGDPPGRYDFSVFAGAHQNGGVTLFAADVRLPA